MLNQLRSPGRQSKAKLTTESEYNQEKTHSKIRETIENLSLNCHFCLSFQEKKNSTDSLDLWIFQAYLVYSHNGKQYDFIERYMEFDNQFK